MELLLAIVGVAGLVLTVASLIYGIRGFLYAKLTNREKEKLEKLVCAELRGFAANIEWIHENANWADTHFKGSHKLALKLDTTDEAREILEHVFKGARDVTAAERMLINLLTQVLSLQEGLFGTRRITKHTDVER